MFLRDSELHKNSVCRNFRRTAHDGKSYDMTHYNLDILIEDDSTKFQLKGGNT